MDPDVHLGLTAQQVVELRLAQGVLDRLIDGDPDRADGAVAVAHAHPRDALVLAAEVPGVEIVSERSEHRTDADLLRRPGELIAAVAAAHAVHQAAAAEQPHQLVNVGRAEALPLGELGSGQRPLWFASDLEQTAEPVFLLRTEPHGTLIRKTYETVKLIGRGLDALRPGGHARVPRSPAEGSRAGHVDRSRYSVRRGRRRFFPRRSGAARSFRGRRGLVLAGTERRPRGFAAAGLRGDLAPAPGSFRHRIARTPPARCHRSAASGPSHRPRAGKTGLQEDAAARPRAAPQLLRDAGLSHALGGAGARGRAGVRRFG